MKIDANEIVFSKLSVVDDVGRVFHWRGGIYRGIYPGAVPLVQELFTSGLVDELTQRHLFPPSKLTGHTLGEFPLVIEHQVVQFATYPQEWSFDMFRDAALSVLDVIKIAAQFGWRMKDCHPYNVLFDGVRPLYVDLGSFVKAAAGDDSFSDAEFLGYYWYPLSIWADGDCFLAQRIISSEYDLMSLTDWFSYNFPFIRGIKSPWKARAIHLYQRVARRAATYLGGKNPSRPIAWLVSHLPAEIVVDNTGLLQAKIRRLPTPPPNGVWHDYQDEYFVADAMNATPRFDRIVDIVRSLDCSSVVELAANQGLLGLLLLKDTQIDTVVCTDADSDAINRLYRRCLDKDTVSEAKLLQPAVTDMMIPRVNFFTTLPVQRFRADLVTALAITHHLTLSQKYTIQSVMETIAGYTERYALIEFMPLGLWDGTSAPPLPAWYNLEWFQKAFCEIFDLILSEKIEANRIIFLGRLKIHA